MLKKHILLALIALTTYSIDMKTSDLEQVKRAITFATYKALELEVANQANANKENRDPAACLICKKTGCLGVLPGQKYHSTTRDFTVLENKQTPLNNWKHQFLPIPPNSN